MNRTLKIFFFNCEGITPIRSGVFQKVNDPGGGGGGGGGYSKIRDFDHFTAISR